MAVLVENSGRESVLAMATPFSTTVASLVGGASAVATFGLADIAVQDVPKWCREASMSSTKHALGFGRSLPLDEWRRPSWRIHLQGSDTVWAIAFLFPYVGVFVAFVAYPVVFGLWMGHDPALYGLLMSDPRFADTAINTLVFVAIGVNVTMFGALLLVGLLHAADLVASVTAGCVSDPMGIAWLRRLHLDSLHAGHPVGPAR